MPGSDTKDEETPHPPATAEFGFVQPGGPPHLYPPEGSVEVTKLSVGPYDNNVYVIASAGEAVIVDGAAEPERILALVGDLRVRAIVQTHGHADHVQALEFLLRELRSPVMGNPGDEWPVPTEPLLGDERLAVGSGEILVIHTPGHTPGSTCFLAGRHLFTGDTLFPGGPGNTDGQPERFTRIMRSIDELFELPDETRVSPGHGLDTTLGRERPHVEVWRSRGW